MNAGSLLIGVDLEKNFPKSDYSPTFLISPLANLAW